MATVNWPRLAGGALAGIVAAGVTVFAVEFVSHMIWPPPAGTDVTSSADLARIMDVMPVGAKIAVMVAWFMGALAGGLIAKMIARHGAGPGIVAGFIVAGGIASFAAIPHSLWMIVAGVLLPVVAGWIAHRAVANRAAP